MTAVICHKNVSTCWQMMSSLEYNIRSCVVTLNALQVFVNVMILLSMLVVVVAHVI
jgi:hypothetical protein